MVNSENSMQGVCHLLTNIGMYCKETLSSCPYGASELDDTRNDSETLPEYESMDLENLVFQKVSEEIEARKRTTQSIPFHFHMPEALSGLVEGTGTCLLVGSLDDKQLG